MGGVISLVENRLSQNTTPFKLNSYTNKLNWENKSKFVKTSKAKVKINQNLKVLKRIFLECIINI